MKSKFKRAIRLLLLGTLNGAIYSAIMLLFVTFQRASIESQNISEAKALGMSPVLLGSNERWTGIVIALILLFSFASYVVNRLCSARLQVSILFWELVGVIAVSAWNVFMLTATWLEKELSAQTMTYDRITMPSNPIFGPTSLVVVVIVNFLYAHTIRLFENRS